MRLACAHAAPVAQHEADKKEKDPPTAIFPLHAILVHEGQEAHSGRLLFVTPGLPHSLRGVGLGLILLRWCFWALFLPLALVVRFYRLVG
jgi:hypothetical protein